MFVFFVVNVNGSAWLNFLSLGLSKSHLAFLVA